MKDKLTNFPVFFLAASGLINFRETEEGPRKNHKMINKSKKLRALSEGLGRRNRERESPGG